jgi:hypothetical protein
MEARRPKIAAVDLVAKSQLALIHAATTYPALDWEVVQQLVHLWRLTNAARYRAAGVAPEELRASLRMVFRDYVHEVRQDDPEAAERFRAALAPELDD